MLFPSQVLLAQAAIVVNCSVGKPDSERMRRVGAMLRSAAILQRREKAIVDLMLELATDFPLKFSLSAMRIPPMALATGIDVARRLGVPIPRHSAIDLWAVKPTTKQL